MRKLNKRLPYWIRPKCTVFISDIINRWVHYFMGCPRPLSSEQHMCCSMTVTDQSSVTDTVTQLYLRSKYRPEGLSSIYCYDKAYILFINETNLACPTSQLRLITPWRRSCDHAVSFSNQKYKLIIMFERARIPIQPGDQLLYFVTWLLGL